MEYSYGHISEKWGKVPHLTFKQSLTIAELLGSQATHPSEIVAFANALYYDKENNEIATPKMKDNTLNEKKVFIEIGMETWELNNIWDGVEEWVNPYKEGNVINLHDYKNNLSH